MKADEQTVRVTAKNEGNAAKTGSPGTSAVQRKTAALQSSAEARTQEINREREGKEGHLNADWQNRLANSRNRMEESHPATTQRSRPKHRLPMPCSLPGVPPIWKRGRLPARSKQQQHSPN